MLRKIRNVSIPHGHPRPSQHTRAQTIASAQLCFNPSRASQAIPTFNAYTYSWAEAMFQSLTGIPGHPNEEKNIGRILQKVVSIPHGHPRPSQLSPYGIVTAFW